MFRSFHAELVEELGVDPSPALAELERRILAHDPELVGPVTGGEPLRGYRLGERLGTGRDGTVYAARLPGVDRDLAVRSLRAEVADNPEFVRAFEAAATRVASLRHPAIVPIHDWWREPGAAYVVMRRMPGGTLRDRLLRSSLADREVVTLVERLGGVLGDAAAARPRARPADRRQRVVRRGRRAGPHRLLARRTGGARARGRRTRRSLRWSAKRWPDARSRRDWPHCSRLPTAFAVEELTERVLAALGAREPSRASGTRTRTRACGRSTRPTPTTSSVARRSSTRYSGACPGTICGVGWCCWSGASGHRQVQRRSSRAAPAAASPEESPAREAWFVATMLARRCAVQGAGGEPASGRGGRHRRPRRAARGESAASTARCGA